jgi:prevent-host-death family protein
MKEVTLREANQQFSRIVREVEETGEAVRVLRNGKPAVDIRPAATKRARRTLTSEQRAALESFLKWARTRPGNSNGRRWTRDELHER